MGRIERLKTQKAQRWQSLAVPPPHVPRTEKALWSLPGEPPHLGPWKSYSPAGASSEKPRMWHKRGRGLGVPAPYLVAGWSFPGSPSRGHLPVHGFEDCGHQGLRVDSVVTCSGEAFTVCKTTCPEQVKVIRMEPSVVGPQLARLEVA